MKCGDGACIERVTDMGYPIEFEVSCIANIQLDNGLVSL
jgi:hypothetical protein